TAALDRIADGLCSDCTGGSDGVVLRGPESSVRPAPPGSTGDTQIERAHSIRDHKRKTVLLAADRSELVDEFAIRVVEDFVGDADQFFPVMPFPDSILALT